MVESVVTTLALGSSSHDSFLVHISKKILQERLYLSCCASVLENRAWLAVTSDFA